MAYLPRNMNKRYMLALGAIIVVASVTVLVVVLVIQNKDGGFKTRRVSTKSGRVTGLAVKTESGGTMNEFYNIPYATPPLGPLRFRTPVVHDDANPWAGDVDATKEEVVSCVQNGNATVPYAQGTEDCLVLTLRSPDLTPSVPAPVIVWIHGGGLMAMSCCNPGYTFDTDTTEKLGLVTVNINYRLGFLGFNSIEELYYRDEEDPSGEVEIKCNNGLRDMMAALQWVKGNVGKFGGDPDRVTIIGHSGGGTAVLALTASDRSYSAWAVGEGEVGLFQGAISLSPAVEMRLDYQEGSDFQNKYMEPLQAADCSFSDDKMNCMRQADASVFTFYDENTNKNGKLKPNNGFAYFDFPWPNKQMEMAGIVMTGNGGPLLPPMEFPGPASSNAEVRQKVNVMVENTVHENGFMAFFVNLNKFDTYTIDQLKEHIMTKFTALTLDEFKEDDGQGQGNLRIKDDVLAKIEKFLTDHYSDITSPQLYWDTLTTDIRSTCPTNQLFRKWADWDAGQTNEKSFNRVYRLFVEFGLTEDFSVIHGWETSALFGFHGLPWITPTSKAWEFRNQMISVIKEFAELPGGDGTMDGWSEDSALILQNDEGENPNYRKYTQTKTLPRQAVCQDAFYTGAEADSKVFNNGAGVGVSLSEFGWQN